MKDSTVLVRFVKSNNSVIVKLEMLSYKISDGEYYKIYEDGFSGYYSSKYGLNGDGMGMRMIRELLKLNNCTIDINRNIKPHKNVDGILAEFEVNEFILTFG